MNSDTDTAICMDAAHLMRLPMAWHAAVAFDEAVMYCM